MTRYNLETNYWYGKSYKKWRKGEHISASRDKINFRDFKKEQQELMQYHLWMEGYSITGNESKATYLGTFTATSFVEACKKWHESLPEESRKNYLLSISANGTVTYWSCRIFDNELDARKSFG